ncbi:hypothetical protein [Halomonas hibernica]|uniref:hypothetical protein n=1 Tax=Halomonas hibernica TaxID=2591147 RepID=UPI0015553602|nr:hypothetical protein [Halomonas hibernica]
MALKRLKDLDLRFSSADVYEWQHEGVRFRYDRRLGAVARESNVNEFEDWQKLEQNDLNHAKQAVFNLINEEWL